MLYTVAGSVCLMCSKYEYSSMEEFSVNGTCCSGASGKELLI